MEEADWLTNDRQVAGKQFVSTVMSSVSWSVKLQKRPTGLSIANFSSGIGSFCHARIVYITVPHGTVLYLVFRPLVTRFFEKAKYSAPPLNDIICPFDFSYS